MKVFEMLIENELTDGVFRVGLVDEPAIQDDFILLKKDEDKLKFEILLESIDKKRKIVCGPLLIPDKIILRKDDNNEKFGIKFSSDVIRRISQDFMINNYKDNISYMHQTPINDVNLIESWIVEDSENDKSNFLGKKVPPGTWMVSYLIKNEELWNQSIKNGLLKGFSIEGKFTWKESEPSVELKLEHSHEEDNLSKDITEIVLNLSYYKKDLDKKYIWKMSKSDKNCPSCKELDGKIHTLKEWMRIAIPGVPNGIRMAGLKTEYQYSPFGTFFEGNCSCKLIPLE